MTPLKDWSVKLLAAGAVLGGIVAGVNNLDALADMQPMATKAWVTAQNDTVIGILQKMQWSDAIDRYNLLDYQIRQLTALELELKDGVEAETDPAERRRKQALLTDLSRDLEFKIETHAKLRCQIDAGTADAAC